MQAAASTAGSCSQRLSLAVSTFITRALRNRRLAYALIAEPVDPQVEAERLNYRQAYAKILETLLEEGMASGEFVRQDAHISAAALVGLLGETMLGPLLHSAPAARQSVADSIIALCLRAVGVKP